MTRRARVTAAVVAVYAVGLAFLLFWSGAVTRPFDPVLRRLRELVPYGDTLLEIGANVVVFIPLGALIVWLLPRRRWWLGILAGIAVSVAAELVQAMFLSDRVGSARDVFANSLGVCLGAGTVAWLTRRNKPRPGKAPDGET